MATSPEVQRLTDGLGAANRRVDYLERGLNEAREEIHALRRLILSLAESQGITGDEIVRAEALGIPIG